MKVNCRIIKTSPLTFVTEDGLEICLPINISKAPAHQEFLAEIKGPKPQSQDLIAALEKLISPQN